MNRDARILAASALAADAILIAFAVRAFFHQEGAKSLGLVGVGFVVNTLVMALAFTKRGERGVGGAP